MNIPIEIIANGIDQFVITCITIAIAANLTQSANIRVTKNVNDFVTVVGNPAKILDNA